MEFIEQGSLKSIAKKNIIEVRFSSPGKRVANPAFRNKTMNMRIPLKVSAKGVEDANEAWSKEFGFIVFMKQTKDNTTDGGKEAVKERTVLKKEGTEFFGDGKNAVPVLYIDDFEGHGSVPVNRVFSAAVIRFGTVCCSRLLQHCAERTVVTKKMGLRQRLPGEMKNGENRA